jgi:hypothetical protein
MIFSPRWEAVSFVLFGRDHKGAQSTSVQSRPLVPRRFDGGGVSKAPGNAVGSYLVPENPLTGWA